MTQSISEQFNNINLPIANMDFASLYPGVQKTYTIHRTDEKSNKIKKILERIDGLSQEQN
jgi:DNA polymerase elongation subunit (family B)